MLFTVLSNSSVFAFDGSPLAVIRNKNSIYLPIYLAIIQQTKARNQNDKLSLVDTSILVFEDMGFTIPFLNNLRIKLELAIPRQSFMISLMAIILFYLLFFTLIFWCFQEYKEIMTGNIDESILITDKIGRNKTKND